MQGVKAWQTEKETGKDPGAGGKSGGSVTDSGWRRQLCRQMYLWVRKQQGLGGACCCGVVMPHVFGEWVGWRGLWDPSVGSLVRRAVRSLFWSVDREQSGGNEVSWIYGRRRCWHSHQTAGWVSFGYEPRVTSFTNVDWVVEGLQVLSSLVFIVYSEPERAREREREREGASAK